MAEMNLGAVILHCGWLTAKFYNFYQSCYRSYVFLSDQIMNISTQEFGVFPSVINYGESLLDVNIM